MDYTPNDRGARISFPISASLFAPLALLRQAVSLYVPQYASGRSPDFPLSHNSATAIVQHLRAHLINISQPRCERFSRSARRDEEIVVDTTMTRSNKAMRENRRNPSGYGHSAPDTASLLLEVVSTTPASSLLVPTRNGQYRDWSYC